MKKAGELIGVDMVFLDEKVTLILINLSISIHLTNQTNRLAVFVFSVRLWSTDLLGLRDSTL